MTIEYKDSKRIVGLERTGNTPDVEEDFSTDNSYDTQTGTAYTVDYTTDDRIEFDFTKDGSTHEVSFDLESMGGFTMDSSSWVAEWTFKVLDSFAQASTSGAHATMGISSVADGGNNQTGDHVAVEIRNVAGAGSLMNLTGGVNSGMDNVRTTGSVDVGTNGFERFIRLTKNGNTCTLQIYTDSNRSTTPTTHTITLAHTVDMKYFRVLNFTGANGGSNAAGNLSVDDFKFYNGITSAPVAPAGDIKPTNVQDNSIFVEKDTAKRYWATRVATSADFTVADLDRIDIPLTGVSTLTSGSISFWVNLNNAGGDNQTVIGGSVSSAGSSEFNIWSGISNITIFSRGGSGNVTATAGSLSNDTWYHVVYTTTSGSNKVYINGSQVTPTYTVGSASTQSFFGSVSSIDTMTIGANKDSGGYQWGFDGNIQQVLIYSSTLTQSEITALYNSGNYNSSPSATNLLRRYELTSNANDTSGNSHNGTATGVTFTSEAIPNSPTTTATWTKELYPFTSSFWAAGGTASPWTAVNYHDEFNGSTWSNATALSTAVQLPAGAGTKSDGSIFGGDTGGWSSPSAITQEWNGSSWSAGGVLSTARHGLAGGGNGTSDMLAVAGYTGSNISSTEEYNGTAWSAGGAISTARRTAAGGGIISNSWIAGGYGGSDLSSTEEYNGTSWSAGASLSTTLSNLTGAGAGQTDEGWFTGGSVSGGRTDDMNLYNGTAWSAGGLLSNNHEYVYNGGSQSDAIAGMGYVSSYTPTWAELYNGTSWSTTGSVSSGRTTGAGGN